MKQKWKGSAVLGLSLAMVLAVSACTSNGNSSPTNAPAEQPSATNTAEVTKEGPSWTWDTSEWEIGEWYIGIPGVDMKYDPVNKMVDKAIFEKTGLKNVTWTTSPTAADEKLSAMIASNTLPDVITVAANSVEKIHLLQSGLVEPLLPLFEEHAPTIIPDLNQDAINWRKAEDGNWYAFPSNTYTGREARPMDSVSILWLAARTDIMNDLGLKPEDFKTQDGFVEALKKVKAANLTSNGAPLLPLLTWELAKPYDFAGWVGQYFAIKYEDKDGNYVPVYENPEMWEFLGFLNRLYREGLLTEQNILMKTEEAREIALKDGFFMNFAFDPIVGQMMTRNKESNGEIHYTGLETPRNSKGEDPIYTSTSVSSGYTVTFVTKTAKNKDRIAKLFDFLYSKEGQVLTFYGIEGTHYDWIDGYVPQLDTTQKVVKVRPEYDAELSSDKAAAKKKYGTQEWFMLQDLKYIQSIGYQMPYDEKQPWEQMRDDLKDFNGEKGKGFDKYIIRNDAVSASAVAPDPDSEAADIMAKLNVYLTEQSMKALTAKTEADFDKLKQEALDHMNKLGLPKLKEAQNEKFQAAKEKFGVKFSYPQLGK